MENIKPCYEKTVKKISDELNKYDSCFKFAMVTDTHLDNSIPDTINNIKAVDKNVNFNCLLHMGDFMNGNIPRKYTKEILKEQVELFRDSISTKDFFPTEGNHDGHWDYTFYNAQHIALDEDWYEATSFTEDIKRVSRQKNKPYFYADYPEYKVRIIVICSFYNEGLDGKTKLKKVYGISSEQLKWLEETLSSLQKDWTVMFLSHVPPFPVFCDDVCKDNTRPNGNETMELIKSKSKEIGFSVACWFLGDYHGDLMGNFNSINFVITANETAYVPQLWNMPEGGYFPERSLNTDTEDLWDAVVLDKENRKIRIFRFGAGKDREISY